MGMSPASGDPIGDKRAEAARLAAQLDRQNNRISVIDEQLDQARLKVRTTQASLDQARASMANTDRRFNSVKASAQQVAVSAYMGDDSSSVGQLNQLLQTSAGDLVIRRQYLDTAAGDQQQALDNL